jgi:exonuclease III
MKIIFWNIRGLGGASRRGQFKHLMSQHHLEVVCLQETIKRDYTNQLLVDLVNGQDFSWIWTEAEGHSRGTLTGVKNDDIEVLSSDRGVFFSSIRAKSSQNNLKWEVINIYIGMFRMRGSKIF